MQKNKVLLRLKLDAEIKKISAEIKPVKNDDWIFTEELEGETPLGGEMRLKIDLSGDDAN